MIMTNTQLKLLYVYMCHILLILRLATPLTPYFNISEIRLYLTIDGILQLVGLFSYPVGT